MKVHNAVTDQPYLNPTRTTTAAPDLTPQTEFAIKNLLNFKTKKRNNKKLIDQLVNDLTKIHTNNENESVLIRKLRNAQYGIPQQSRRLSTLLFTLRKQIENARLYREMGISQLYPNNAPEEEPLNNEKNNREKLLLALMNCPNDEWTKHLSIVCVYGSINSHGNAYGHSLLRLGNLGYLHVNNLLNQPTFIPHNEFKQYLMRNQSFVVDIQQLPSALNTNKVKETIANYANHPWFWRITHHNCLTFARQIARKCGVSHEQLGGGRGLIKTPIDFFMELDIEKELDILPNDKKPNWLKKHFITNPIDNINALAGAASQLGKNTFNSAYARVDILPGFFKPPKENNEDKENTDYKDKKTHKPGYLV